MKTGKTYLEDTKNGYSRYVPLSDAACQAIDKLPKQSDEVFPISANAIRLAWERLKKKHSIEGIRFHDLRHEAISRMFDEGLTVPEVASISGNGIVSMLFRYAHISFPNLYASKKTPERSEGSF